MHEVSITPMTMSPIADVIGEQRWGELAAAGAALKESLGDAVVWNVNSTSQGGGVAEMLQTLLAYCRHAGVDTRWLVLDGEPMFFATTKRMHNVLHGEPGDGGPLGDAERSNYEDVATRNLAHYILGPDPTIKPGDVVILHDPQTAGMAPALKEHGVRVIWRSHIGRDEPNEHTDRGWAFLAPYIAHADRVVVSRAAYAPPGVPLSKVTVIAPSIDPFATKNATLGAEEALAVLVRAGIVEGDDDGAELTFARRDGSSGVVRKHGDDLMIEGGPVPAGARVVTQVSRWDHLKDMPGVTTGFVEEVSDPDAHLVLAGPAVAEVSDDPEGALVLAECISRWQRLPEDQRRRVHLAAVPMDDVDENAHIINALQTHSAIVAQKSLREGFGLTVTEAMWKARPVIASRIGGIQDQIVHERDGLLVDDPTDLASFGQAVQRVLADDDLARQLGDGAKERVRTDFLGDRHLLQYVELIRSVLTL